MRRNGACHCKLTRLHADRNRNAFALPRFLENATAPPVDGAAPEHMLNRAHVDTPVYRRVLQSQSNAPAKITGNFTGNLRFWGLATRFRSQKPRCCSDFRAIPFAN